MEYKRCDFRVKPYPPLYLDFHLSKVASNSYRYDMLIAMSTAHLQWNEIYIDLTRQF